MPGSLELAGDTNWLSNDKTSWAHYSQLFWDGQQKFTHPKAELYIGWHSPNFKLHLTAVPGTLPPWASTLLDRLKDYLNQSFIAHQKGLVDKIITTLREMMIPQFQAADAYAIPAYSWNHAKIVAVNGTTLTTGGANMWNEYGDGAHGTCDAQVKIKGDAAIQAHKYADALWEDMILQVIWLELTQKPAEKENLKHFPVLVYLLSDVEIMKPLQHYKISPAAWASKASRNHALENAQNEIVISQQALVQTMLIGRPGIVKVAKDLHDYFNIKWDGAVLPLDTMFPLCKGLLNIFQNHPQDKSFGAKILLTTKTAGGGYGDSASWTSFRTNLVQVLQLMSDSVDAAQFIAERVHCKRVLGNDGRYGNHGKMVCVDKSLLYVGSDNVYPQANMQHGVWIEDRKNINAWYDQFFNEAWNKGADAID